MTTMPPAHWLTTPPTVAPGDKCSCCNRDRLVLRMSAVVCEACDHVRGWPNGGKGRT